MRTGKITVEKMCQLLCENLLLLGDVLEHRVLLIAPKALFQFLQPHRIGTSILFDLDFLTLDMSPGVLFLPVADKRRHAHPS